MTQDVWQDAVGGWWFEPIMGAPEGPFSTKEAAERAQEDDLDMWESDDV